MSVRFISSWARPTPNPDAPRSRPLDARHATRECISRQSSGRTPHSGRGLAVFLGTAAAGSRTDTSRLRPGAASAGRPSRRRRPRPRSRRRASERAPPSSCANRRGRDATTTTTGGDSSCGHAARSILRSSRAVQFGSGSNRTAVVRSFRARSPRLLARGVGPSVGGASPLLLTRHVIAMPRCVRACSIRAGLSGRSWACLP